MKSVTIYDVAREAGVSMATVSRVVNGNPNVKPTTRKKVIEAIKRLGYRPNAVARGLASKRTTTVGVIIPDISSLFYAELARGIEDIANMYHYNIILCNSDQKKEKEIHLVNTLLEKQVDGLLFMGSQISEEHKEVLKTSSAPIILSATATDDQDIPSVNIDYMQASYDAVQMFIKRGHRRIAIISGPLTDPRTDKLRMEGYHQAMKSAQLPVDERYIVYGDYRYESGYQGMESFLERNEKPTAVVVMSDEMAVGAIHACLDNGVKVPDDVEIIGFDNTRLCTMVRPTLSSVVQPMYDIGAVSMRLLTKFLNNEHVDNHVVILPHRIEERGSTKSE